MIRAMAIPPRFKLDPWSLDYEAPLGALDQEPPDAVDWKVETEDWHRPPPRRRAPASRPLAFIDGRRRVESRLLDTDEATGAMAHAALGAIAVGAVLVDPAERAARFGALTIRRVLAGPPDRALPALTAGGFTYAPLDDEPLKLAAPEGAQGADVPVLALQSAMIWEEARLAAKLAEGGALVIRDGPLRWHPVVDTLVVGYVKTQQRPYLAGEQQALVRRLGAGERTPLFRLGSPGSERARLSWYLRLAPVPAGAHDLAGIVRLEVLDRLEAQGDGGAIALADALAEVLPRYASHPTRDPRAPQNLVPVAALERELGRRMGDALLVSRRIRADFASQGARP